MKQFLLAAFGLFSLSAIAQQKEGRVVYSRTVQMQITFSGAPPPGAENIPKSRTEKFELNFADNKMTYKRMEELIPEDNFGGGGIVFRTVGGGADDVTYCDFSKALKLESREFFDKKFLITDTIKKESWKLSEETRTILGHLCRKATTTKIVTRMQMGMTNGQMERKEIQDTGIVTAWFTMDIPVPAGPDMQGQLPGLILELEANHGKTVYTALEIHDKPEKASIKEPTKGKKLTAAEFVLERNKLLEEMQGNNQGGNIRLRMN